MRRKFVDWFTGLEFPQILVSAVFLLIVIWLASGIYSAGKPPAEDNVETVCLDGVSYWYRRSSLAPRIDPQTLLPARCANLDKKAQ